AAIITTLAGSAVTTYITPHIIKEPMYNSTQTGEEYIQELLHGHPQCIHNTLGVHKHIF
ncbi:hypothetical protein C8Q77DRAFT_1061988, partial [Trametes polyzona]